MKKLFIILFIAIVSSCSDSYELTDSIHIPDSEDPNLPAYTEWGYNTFGANYDRSIFKDSYETPLKVTTQANNLAFIFNGATDNYDALTLRFILPNTNVTNYNDLIHFNDSTINLLTNNVTVDLISSTFNGTINILEGELYFKRTQKVYIDDEIHGVILSGYFDLKYVVDNIPSNISNGRFDMVVNNQNFYILK